MGTKISTANIPTAIQVGGNFNLSSAWLTSTNYSLPVSLQGTTARLVFEWSNDAYSGNQRPAAVDNISLTAITCIAPTALTASITPQTTATLSWTENGTATTWGIEYGVTGFTPTLSPNETATTTPTKTLTGLTANTTYQYYVRAQCSGSDNSPWAGPFSFETGYCTPTSTETSDYISEFTTTGALTNVTYAAATAPAGQYSDQTAQILETYAGQVIDFTQNYAGGENRFKVWVDWNNDFDFEDVGEQMYNFWSNNTVQTGNVTIPAAVANGNYRMRIRAVYAYTASQTLVPCGSIQYGSAVDFTLNVTTIVSCPAPNALTATALTPTSANLGWTENGTATDWHIEYGVSGFPFTGNPTATVTSNPATVSSLLPNTTYQFYVRAACDVSDFSTWAGPFSFTTPQQIATLPYTDDFSTTQWSFVNGNEPNKWYIDPAAVDNINLTVVNCPAPTALNATNITTTSAELSWTETAIATDWEIQYGVATFFPNAGPVLNASSNTYTLAGLQPNTMYDYYVRAKCGTNDESAWSGPFRFTTLCEVITTLPWSENFDNLPFVGPQIFPSCWFDENPGDWFTEDNFSGPIGQVPFSGTSFLSINDDSDAKIWTPEFQLTAGESYEFSFQYAGDLGAGWDGSVYVNNAQSSTGATMLGSAFIINGDSTIIDYQQAKFCFSPNATGSYTFGVYVVETNYEYRLRFDDFELKLAPTYPGTDGVLDVCQSGAAVDLNSVITTTYSDGTWIYTAFPASVTGNMFDPSLVTPGVHEILFLTNTCAVDTIKATITVESSASAGIDGNLVVCRNEPMNLFDGLTGNFEINGVWKDPSNAIVTNGTTVSSNIPGQYNFKYVVNNTTCPNDSAKVIVSVQGCNYLGVDEITFKTFNLYPNPTSDIIYISNSGSLEVFNYEVADMNGRVILKANQAINGNMTTELNLSNVENGVYLIRVFNENADKTFRVVKN